MKWKKKIRGKLFRQDSFTFYWFIAINFHSILRWERNSNISGYVLWTLKILFNAYYTFYYIGTTNLWTYFVIYLLHAFFYDLSIYFFIVNWKTRISFKQFGILIEIQKFIVKIWLKNYFLWFDAISEAHIRYSTFLNVSSCGPCASTHSYTLRIQLNSKTAIRFPFKVFPIQLLSLLFMASWRRCFSCSTHSFSSALLFVQAKTLNLLVIVAHKKMVSTLLLKILSLR